MKNHFVKLYFLILQFSIFNLKLLFIYNYFNIYLIIIFILF